MNANGTACFGHIKSGRGCDHRAITVPKSRPLVLHREPKRSAAANIISHNVLHRPEDLPDILDTEDGIGALAEFSM